MVSDLTIVVVSASLGFLLGLLMPGYVLYLIALARRYGLSRRLLTRALVSLVMMFGIGFGVLLAIGLWQYLLDIPDDHEPHVLALGFSVLGGLLVGTFALFYGTARGRRKALA